MTLRYSILWIDDSQDWVESVSTEIEAIFSNSDIELDIIKKERGSHIESDLRKNCIDLLVVDQNLPERNGDDLIKKVREQGEILEVIFYSNDDLQTNPVTQWEGVHFVNRSDAEDKIKCVIDGFVEKNKSISLMRGIIIAEAIDVENKLTEIIKKTFGDKSDFFKSRILDKAWLDFSKKADFVQSCLNEKLKIIREETPTDELKITTVNECCEILKMLKSEVINQRNILAHSEKSFNDEGCLVLQNLANTSPKQIVFNTIWKNEIRANIRKHRENLQKIYDLL